jgi:hypothetical protein
MRLRLYTLCVWDYSHSTALLPVHVYPPQGYAVLGAPMVPLFNPLTASTQRGVGKLHSPVPYQYPWYRGSKLGMVPVTCRMYFLGT